MGKEATNLTLPKDVKARGVSLAKRAGMSLSTYVAQLIIKEAAREAGFIKESPALYAAGESQEKIRTKRT
jgi:predicted DNA-binding protein